MINIFDFYILAMLLISAFIIGYACGAKPVRLTNTKHPDRVQDDRIAASQQFHQERTD
jgi:hypothetical protein